MFQPPYPHNKPRQVEFLDDKMRIFRDCSISGLEYSVTVSKEAHDKWRSGTLIQVAMPELDSDQREFLISNTTPAEWKQIFGS